MWQVSLEIIKVIVAHLEHNKVTLKLEISLDIYYFIHYLMTNVSGKQFVSTMPIIARMSLRLLGKVYDKFQLENR